MRSYFAYLWVALGLPFYSSAKEITPLEAQQVATAFCQHKLGRNNVSLQAAAPSVSSKNASTSVSAQPLYYLFTLQEGGFVIIAGDDRVVPVLAYAEEGTLSTQNTAPAFKSWIEYISAQIKEAIEQHVPTPATTIAQWQALRNNALAPVAESFVLPLIQTQWKQSGYYNAMCPDSSVVGCVATAMSQIMKYWNYPTRGRGFHSYNHDEYGTLSADFANTTYDYNSMPNQVTAPNPAVALLSYHCGVSVDMDYSRKGSAAQSSNGYLFGKSDAETAFKTYFGYNPSMYTAAKDNFTDSAWSVLLKGELDAGRPLMYGGFGIGGHAFIIDGYDNNGLFHVNWGWGGSQDGYFFISALNPSLYNFSYGQDAMIDLKPAPAAQAPILQIHTPMSLSSDTIQYLAPLIATTNVTNASPYNFMGDIALLVFNMDNNFIMQMDMIGSTSLAPYSSYNTPLNFSHIGMFALVPGAYRIGLYYRTPGGMWQKVENSSAGSSTVTLQVENYQTRALASPIALLPSQQPLPYAYFVNKDSSATFQFSITNHSTAPFTGTYALALYRADGVMMQVIDSVQQWVPLAPSATTNPLQFSTPAITTDQGSYDLMATYREANSSVWKPLGAQHFNNPYPVVVTSILPPDVLEPNNEIVDATLVTPNFINDTASINYPMLNIHDAVDEDLFRIPLQGGYKYTIVTMPIGRFLQPQTYTNEVIASVSLDTGSSWKYVQGNITALQANTDKMIYYSLAPRYSCMTGTYGLKMLIKRTKVNGLQDRPEAFADISLHPNPADDAITITGLTPTPQGHQIELVTLMGQVLHSTSTRSSQSTLNTASLPTGTYLLRIVSEQGSVTKKITVVH